MVLKTRSGIKERSWGVLCFSAQLDLLAALLLWLWVMVLGMCSGVMGQSWRRFPQLFELDVLTGLSLWLLLPSSSGFAARVGSCHYARTMVSGIRSGAIGPELRCILLGMPRLTFSLRSCFCHWPPWVPVSFEGCAVGFKLCHSRRGSFRS